MEDIKKTEEFLLDLFAKDAMNSLYSYQEWNSKAPTAEKIAELSYDMATAMILERRKRLPAT